MKRWIVLALALLLLAGSADAQIYIRSGQLSQAWGCSLTALVASLTQCKAVPDSATQRYYITDIVVQTTTTTAGTYAIRSGTGTNCATGTLQVFPASGTGSDRFTAPISTSPTATIHLVTPIAVTAGHAVCVIGTATNTINIHLLGWMQ